ncbi:flippase-like domain-containing protein [Myxococcota bacterium]|nr:flippase-like domain-containing protein [Myxococcota bacterium]
MLGVLVLGGAFVVQMDASDLHMLATPRAAGWLTVALLCFCVGQVLNGLAWRHLLHGQGGRVPFMDMIRHDLASVFWSTVLPGGVVGEVVKGVRLARDADAGAVAVSILSARLVGGATACLLALACLPFSGIDGAFRAIGALALALTALVGLGGLVALALGPAALPLSLRARLPVGRMPSARDLLLAFVLALVTHSAFALVYCAGFAATGPWIPFADGAVLSALTSVAQLLPVSVGGLGVRELTISGLGARLVPKPAADAAAVALALVFTVFVALGGLVELGRVHAARR